MSANRLVVNLTRGWKYRYRAAVQAVENCACAWVEFGVSIRDLGEQEASEARKRQEKALESLPFAELPNCVYRPAEQAQALTRAGYPLVRAANQFAAMQNA